MADAIQKQSKEEDVYKRQAHVTPIRYFYFLLVSLIIVTPTAYFA